MPSGKSGVDIFMHPVETSPTVRSDKTLRPVYIGNMSKQRTTCQVYGYKLPIYLLFIFFIS